MVASRQAPLVIKRLVTGGGAEKGIKSYRIHNVSTILSFTRPVKRLLYQTDLKLLRFSFRLSPPNEPRINLVIEELLTIGDWFGAVGASVAKSVHVTLHAVGRVHRVPRLPQPVRIVSDSRMREGGKYRWNPTTGAPLDIRLNPKSDHLELTFALEIGHLLDHQALAARG